MKRKVLALAVLLLVLMAFASCSGGYKDGTYQVEATEFEHGWKDYLIIEVVDGKVAVKEFDSLNEAGTKKSQDADYRTAMEPVSGTYPEKYIADIISEFQKKGSADKMDSITGATQSTNSFKTLLSEALIKAKKGETISAVAEGSSK